MVSIAQDNIIPKIKSYAALHNIDIPEIKGLCNGLAALWLVKKQEDNEQWMFSMLERIANLDDKELKDFNPDLEKLINHIFWLHLPSTYGLPINQWEFNKTLDLEEEFSFAFTLTTSELRALLSEVIYDNKMVQISSDDHAIALMKKNGKIFLYDANYNDSYNQAYEMSFAEDDFKKLTMSIRNAFGWEDNIPIAIHVWDNKNAAKAKYPAPEEIAQQIIRDRPNINIQSNHGWSALHMAAENGDLQVVELLTQHSADLSLVRKGEVTPLISAAMRGHVDIMELLLKKGADPKVLTVGRNTLLHAACLSKNVKCIQYVLEKFPTLINQGGYTGKTPIFYSVDSGNIEAVKLLLNHGADAKAESPIGNLLAYAVFRKNLPAVRELIESYTKEEINASKLFDEGVSTPICSLAALKGDATIMELLIEKGLDIHQKDTKGFSPIHYACASGSVKMVELLLKHGAQLDDTGPEGELPIDSAIVYRKKDIFKFMRENNKEVELSINHIFAAAAQDMLAECLPFYNGAELSVTDAQGLSLMHYAAVFNDVESIHALCKRGLDINVSNEQDVTPLNIALQKKNIQAARAIIKSDGFDVNFIQGPEQAPPLMLLAIYGVYDLIPDVLDKMPPLTDRLLEQLISISFGRMDTLLDQFIDHPNTTAHTLKLFSEYKDYLSSDMKDTLERKLASLNSSDKRKVQATSFQKKIQSSKSQEPKTRTDLNLSISNDKSKPRNR